MQNRRTALIIVGILAIPGCRTSTIVAEEVSDTLPFGTDTTPDTVTGAEASTDSDSRNTDPTPDSEAATDSDSQTASCEGRPAPPGDSERTIQVGDATRSYVLHIPNTYTGNEPAPLLIDFHAISGTGEDQLAASIYPTVTDPEGVIMAFPTGLRGPLGTAWNIGPCCVDGADDVAFTLAMIADIQRTACIDSSRVYAAGVYIGGGLAYHLACHEADVFAAVASSAFDLDQEAAITCAPDRPITVVSFRTVDDPILSYEGGRGEFFPNPLDFLGAEGTFAKWAEINGCTGDASDAGDGCRLYAASQCAGGVEVVLCTASGVLGDGAIAWPVLRRHSLPR